VLVVPLCLSAAPATGEAEQVTELQAELSALAGEIEVAETEEAQLSEGLLKDRLQVRIEILKTTHALVQQRIHALESGAPIRMEIPAVSPDDSLAAEIAAEMSAQEGKIRIAREEAAKYGRSVIGGIKQTTVATLEQTRAMLWQRYLSAKFGIPVLPTGSSHPATDQSSGTSIGIGEDTRPTSEFSSTGLGGHLEVTLLDKDREKSDYQEFIVFNIELTAVGLDKPARAIKGLLQLQDLFGETKMQLKLTISDPLSPGQSIVLKDVGFKYNQFKNEHRWTDATGISDMRADFVVTSILYEDGSKWVR
jgi:hypothetical protein